MMVAAGGAVLWSIAVGQRRPSRPEPPLPTEAVDLQGAEVYGGADAAVVAILYSDFQCPFCKRFAQEVWPDLSGKFGDSGDVAFAFRHLPLERIHPQAFRAATVAWCAGRLGRFWAAHDALFEGGLELDKDQIGRLGDDIDVDRSSLEACVDGSDAVQAVRADIKAAAALGISSTPTFLVGVREGPQKVRIVRRINGALTAAELASIVDDIRPPRGNTR